MLLKFDDTVLKLLYYPFSKLWCHGTLHIRDWGRSLAPVGPKMGIEAWQTLGCTETTSPEFHYCLLSREDAMTSVTW